MGYPTPIEWTDATWNPIGGCSIKSPGCAPCYAQRLAGTRLANHPLYAETTTTVKGKPVFNGKLTVSPDDHPTWRWPISWRGAAKPKIGAGNPSLIFVGDMSDLFHEDRARADQDRTIASIIHSRHIGQLLTKRPDVMRDYFFDLHAAGRWFFFPHPLFGEPNFEPEATTANVLTPKLWLGISAERQREFDERWPSLRALAWLGYTIFVSYEPAIGPLVLPDDFLVLGPRAQVIAGGMSGDDASPAHPDWFRDVRDQCSAADVAFFFKQWGEWAPGECADKPQTRTERVAEFFNGKWDYGELTPKVSFETHTDDAPDVWRFGKKAAGRLLDGREHNDMPTVRNAKSAAAPDIAGAAA